MSDMQKWMEEVLESNKTLVIVLVIMIMKAFIKCPYTKKGITVLYNNTKCKKEKKKKKENRLEQVSLKATFEMR